jgi:DNA-binding transcriptional MerR regulator
MTANDTNDNTLPVNRKTYYSIREVSEQTGLEPHVLRYWESEFPQLRPKKNRAGNRAYRGKDIELIHYIKRLLYEEQFTIPGAKKKLLEIKETDKESDGDTPAAAPTPAPIAAEPALPASRETIIHDLKDVLNLLRHQP